MHLKSEVSNLKLAFARAWWYIRQVSGDAAYENYVLRHRSGSHACNPLSREEFYLDALRRRYTGISRCC